ncbi:DUF1638 domain-containing protein [Candidatus Latescibacterota bacterium]
MAHRIRYKLIACGVFRGVFERVRQDIPSHIDLVETWFEQGLHLDPVRLNALISEEIARTGHDGEPPDAILLAYGLCSRGIAGIRSGRWTIVVPRAHDCITLFLGSQERYLEEFTREPGTYWFTPELTGGLKRPGFSEIFPGIYQEFEQQFETYLEKFDDPKLARFIIDSQEQAHIPHYSRGVFIESGVPDTDGLRGKARTYCQERNWNYEEVKGDLSLIRDLLSGKWDEKRYLVVKPNEIIIPGSEKEIISTMPAAD